LVVVNDDHVQRAVHFVGPGELGEGGREGGGREGRARTSMALPEWQESKTAVRRTPAGREATRMACGREGGREGWKEMTVRLSNKRDSILASLPFSLPPYMNLVIQDLAGLLEVHGKDGLVEVVHLVAV